MGERGDITNLLEKAGGLLWKGWSVPLQRSLRLQRLGYCGTDFLRAQLESVYSESSYV